MPELPEVETMRRCVAPVVGRRIRDLEQPRSSLQPIKLTPRFSDFRRRIVGRRISGISRVGKRILVALQDTAFHAGECIVFEPRMSGLVLLAEPPDQQHLRLVFELAGRPRRRLLFWNQRGLGVVRLVSPRAYARYYGPHRVGTDALEISAGQLRERLRQSRRAIKVALLDQRVVAGIGNLYASEILHSVGLHPEARCRELTPGQWRALHAATREILHEAIRHQGSTLRDGTYRIARNEPGKYQVCHRVYQRAGERCLRCDRAEIVRIVQAQRSTFFCPACQPR